MRLILVLVVASSLFGADDKRESGSIPEGDVLPQVVAGGAWSTDIQVMHAHDEDTPQPFTIQPTHLLLDLEYPWPGWQQ